MLATLVALVLYWLLPTTPPRLLGVSSYVDTMEHYAELGLVGQPRPRLPGQRRGPTSTPPSRPCTPVGRSGSRSSSRGCTRDAGPPSLGWLYFLGTSFVVIGTGNHYIIDIVVGAGIMIVAHLVSTHVVVPVG